jgi:hypothetical protein
MVERENLDLCHVFTIYNKLSTFIAQAIWLLKYICINSGTCIVLIEFDVTHNAMLWEKMNVLVPTTT